VTSITINDFTGRGVVPKVILCLKQGVSMWLALDRVKTPQQAFLVNIAETDGTGDCFCGVFARFLSFGMSVKESLRRASAAAALSATRRGAQTSMPSAEEVDRFLSAIGETR